jgi:hypothetical protein
MGKNKGQFKKGRGPFNFSHDKVKEEKTGIDETEKQKTDPEIDDNGWYYFWQWFSQEYSIFLHQ